MTKHRLQKQCPFFLICPSFNHLAYKLPTVSDLSYNFPHQETQSAFPLLPCLSAEITQKSSERKIIIGGKSNAKEKR